VRVLVTGAGGQLGLDAVAALRAGGHEAIPRLHAELDIADPGAAERVIAGDRPDAVLNCAAWTAVDAAEDDPDAASRANAVGPGLLADACAAARVRLCHLSTDFVFDGSATAPMDESTPPHPLGVYGASKLAGEEEVRRRCPDHQVVRTAWLFGREGPNFVLTMLRLARERGALRVVADQRGSPTWTGSLAPALVRLLERGTPGTYHLVNSGEATWYDLAVATLEEAGLAGVPVEPISTADFPTRARRPAYSVLDCRAWRELGEPPLVPWREALRAYISSRR
jgi:dTDP-4-dehydrorhamnose reductase